MGQRLVIKVVKDGKDQIAIYYHWSAYSISALFEAKEVLTCIEDETNPIKDLRLRLIRHLEENGGGIDGGTNSKEGKYIAEAFPNEQFSNCVDRSCGLAAISESGMEEIHGWSEGDIIINLDNETITNDVLWQMSEDGYKDEYEEEDNFVPMDQLSELKIDPTSFSFGELDDVIRELSNADGDPASEYGRWRCGDTVIQLIE